MRNVKWIAVFISLILFFGVMLSSSYIAKEMDHDCIGEDCPICEQMEECSLVLEKAGAACGLALAFVILTICLRAVARPVLTPVLLPTPFSWKVRLNN